MVRHAEREPVRKAEDFMGALLTAQGHQDALEFGRALSGYSAVNAWHSPIERCAQTARGIVAGAVEAGLEGSVVGELEVLGGPYVRDPFLTFKEYVEHKKGFIRAWFDGRYPPEMIASRREASQMQLAAIFDTWNGVAPDTLALFVTHDWNALVIREEVLALRFEEAGWVNFLEGLVLSRRQDDICVRDGELERCLDADTLTGA